MPEPEYKFLIETHCHTAEVSPCADIPGALLAEKSKEKGYDAINITDHLKSTRFDVTAERRGQVEKYLSGFHAAKEAGARVGLTVLRGAELSLDMYSNEYLLFGYGDSLFDDIHEVFKLDAAGLKGYCGEKGILLIQAHPFRRNMVRTSPADVDGVEVYNLHPNHFSNNYLSVEYAKENGLIMTSGTDAHEERHIGRGGVFSKTLPKNETELASLIKSGDFRLKF